MVACVTLPHGQRHEWPVTEVTGMAHHASTMGSGPSPRVLTLACLPGIGVCIAASATSALNGRAPEVFLPVGFSGAVYVLSGYFIALRRPSNRTGPLLMLIGVLPATFVIVRYLSPVSQVLTDSAVAIPALLLAYVLLAFPSGHLTGRAERMTLAVASVYFALFAIAVMLTLEPAANGVSRCPPCAPNPIRITDLSFYPRVLLAGDLGIVLTAAAVSLLCVRRWLVARGAARRVLAPVLFGGIVTAVGFLATSLAALSGSPPMLTGQFLFLLRLLVPVGLALTFVRVYASRAAVAGAVVQLGASPSIEGLEAALRRAVGDPDLVVARWSPAADAYLDREGRRVHGGQAGATRSFLQIHRGGEPQGADLHKP